MLSVGCVGVSATHFGAELHSLSALGPAPLRGCKSLVDIIDNEEDGEPAGNELSSPSLSCIYGEGDEEFNSEIARAETCRLLPEAAARIISGPRAPTALGKLTPIGPNDRSGNQPARQSDYGMCVRYRKFFIWAAYRNFQLTGAERTRNRGHALALCQFQVELVRSRPPEQSL